jgi:hypothetical protein
MIGIPEADQRDCRHRFNRQILRPAIEINERKRRAIITRHGR